MAERMTIQEAGLAIVRRLREHGHQALWAGGCVRDMLLGLPPTDVDVATDAVPDQIVSLFRKTRKVGAQFGVVLVRQGPYWIETATFRSDVDYADGRRPERVVFTTAEHDAQRRDFTINGLFYDPLENQVIDYVGGQADLTAGIIRAIGDSAQRFAEDHLRMLRAVRFAARFHFQIEPATAGAIREHASKITRISAERIREELDKMLSHPSRATSLRLIADLNLLPHLWPTDAAADIDANVAAGLRTGRSDPAASSEPGASATGSALDAAIRRLNALPDRADFVIVMAAWLADRDPVNVRRIARALRCSNEQTDDLVWLVSRQHQLADVERMSLAEFKKLMAHPRFDDLLELHRAVLVADTRPPDTYESARGRAAGIPPAEVAPPPLVTGEDLIAAGLQPGPRFKQILDTLYDAQLNLEITDRAAALERMRAMVNA